MKSNKKKMKKQRKETELKRSKLNITPFRKIVILEK